MDENFPDPLVLEIATRFTPELDLRPIRMIDPKLTGGVGDHRVILGLHQVGIEGLVTNDTNMLSLPDVLSIIEQTGFSVVACESSGLMLSSRLASSSRICVASRGGISAEHLRCGCCGLPIEGQHALKP